MMQPPKSPRLIVRACVRLRRQGGSLILTVPRNVVRHWKLHAGAALVVRSTDNGILLFPRYTLPYTSAERRKELFGR
jgi:antitoxin component of MazEF toxin-antitoxin module